MSDAYRFTGGRIFTGERYAEALLVEDGVVRAVGSAEAVRRSAPTATEHVELHGRLLMPGLIDAHLHIPEVTQAREGLEVSQARSIPELLDRLRQWAALHPRGPIVGRGWSPDRLPEGRWLTALDLDRAVADRPVVLHHVSGHVAVANHAGLTAAGIDAITPDPVGGRLGRETDRTPNGLVFESALRLLAPITAAAFPPEADSMARTLSAAAGLGLTTVATLNTSPEELTVLRDLATRAPLPIRVRVYVRLARWREFSAESLAPLPGNDRLVVIGGKGFVDGAFGPRTAWLSQPYADAPRESGMPIATESELAEAIAWASERRLAPALHAIGDRAVARATRLLTPYRTDEGSLPRIEHASLVPPELFPALDRGRPALIVQPGFLYSDDWLGGRLGTERARSAYAFRTLTDRGYVLAGSSDAPYDPLDPWRGLDAAVNRVDVNGRSANPTRAEALTPEQAVCLYGRNAGIVLGEAPLGTLEVGAPADLILVRAPTVAAAVEAGAPAVVETWVQGERLGPADRKEWGTRV